MKQTWRKTVRSSSLRGRSSVNTAPEVSLRSALHRAGLRFRLYWRIPGTRLSVDIVLPRYKIAIFCDGCFWHSHNCRESRRLVPGGINRAAWRQKMTDVKRREIIAYKLLEQHGFSVHRFWECEIESDAHGIALDITREAKSLKIRTGK